MALREDIERQGNWLFKWRSYVPLACLPILVIALRNSGYLGKNFGAATQEVWRFLCLSVSLLGLGVRTLTAGFVPRGTSGRNTQSQVAETLNTTGMYSIVRNPLYLGNFIIVFGVTLSIQVWWLVVLVCFGFWVYYERIVFAEEEFLRNKFGPSFLKWAEVTPAFFPRLKLWKAPAMPFSFKTVLRREFTTFFGVVSANTFLGIIGDFLSAGKFVISLPWIILYAASVIVYLTLLILKKKTKLLNVQGR
jgi:protein-S-isoprenylcysteine O-methyltransferase Ste14